jgi:DNA replication initiation complex subunit (GINS family)
MGELTYEDLFEILRRERNSDELQQLEDSFYSDLVRYFQSKQAVVDDTSEEAQIFGASERDKVRTQLKNARKIARELVERREKKVVLLALNKARTKSDIIDTSALLDVEEAFFRSCVDLFGEYRGGVLERVVDMDLPRFDGTIAAEGESPRAADEATVDDDSSASTDDRVRFQESVEQDESDDVTVEVKFTSEIPKFLGKDQEVLGPFKADETAELSEEIADVLVKKGRAEKIDA